MQAGLGIPGVCPFAAHESASSWQENQTSSSCRKELDVIVVESGPPRVCWWLAAGARRDGEGGSEGGRLITPDPQLLTISRCAGSGRRSGTGQNRRPPAGLHVERSGVCRVKRNEQALTPPETGRAASGEGGRARGGASRPGSRRARCAVARQQPRACPGSRPEEAANVPRDAVDPRAHLRRTATARAPLRAFRESATSTRRTATRQRPETRR